MADLFDADDEGASFCAIDDDGFTISDRRFFPHLVRFQRPWDNELVRWTEANIGKRGKVWIGSYWQGPLGGDGEHVSFCVRFRSERDAIFFKLRWVG